jgi:hypothetical protein
MRNRIWAWATSGLQQGQILPMWALCVRAVLFPLDFFYWRMSKVMGYDWRTDSLIIDGVRYDCAAFRLLSKANGETYRITRRGNRVYLERVDSQ